MTDLCSWRPTVAVAWLIVASLAAARADEPKAVPATTTLDLHPAPAFTKLAWTGWKPESDAGEPQPFRPILLTHAGDGTNRIFVAEQKGIIHVFPNDPDAAETKVFLDISGKVPYSDKTNEEGFLGLAFHPRYRENGQFFVFHTTTDSPHQTVVSRYQVSKDDPDRADPASGVEILRFTKPFWNHDGGTLTFGPDGYLYIAIGDGGAANDPFGNGQSLKTLLGKILRIDVDRESDGPKGPRAYAIPEDNPFVGREGAKPEIWAYGLRNVWRMAFDPETGLLWAGDVGQDIWEEVDIIEKGANYGWNIREGMHPFVPKGGTPPEKDNKRPDLVDPIWEYHHDVGKSITGGLVYRGKRLPALAGAYLFADYVSGKLWALRYDPARKAVTAHHEIPAPPIAVISFGADERGEAYFTAVSATGQGIYRLDPAPTP